MSNFVITVSMGNSSEDTAVRPVGGDFHRAERVFDKLSDRYAAYDGVYVVSLVEIVSEKSVKIRDNAAVQADIFRLSEHLTWQQRFEIPQTVFNELLNGFQQNLLNPEAQRLTLLGNTALGDALYKNALVVAVAEALSQALEMVREPVNEMFNAGQDALKPVAQALDDVTKQVNGVIDQGRDSIKELGIDVSGPLFDANRQLNNAADPVIEQVQDSIADGIGSVVGGVTDQSTQKGVEDRSGNTEEKVSQLSVQRTAVQDTKPDLEPATSVPDTDQKKDETLVDEQKVTRDTEQKEEPKTPPAVTVKEPTATESPSVPKSESTPQVGTDQGSKGQGTPTSEGDSATKAPKKTFAEKRAEREAKREAKKAEREAKREAKKAEQEARREAKKAEQEAKRGGGSGGASSGGNTDSGSSSGGGSDS